MSSSSATPDGGGGAFPPQAQTTASTPSQRIAKPTLAESPLISQPGDSQANVGGETDHLGAELDRCTTGSRAGSGPLQPSIETGSSSGPFGRQDPSLPQVFGRYLLVQRLSRGGMGEIF